MDVAIDDATTQSVLYKISKWKMDDEDDDDDSNHSALSSINSESPPIRKIFVGNISYRTSYCDLRRLFSRYGTVVDARVSKERFTHARKRFGFVTFKHPEDAASVLQLKPGKLRLHLRSLYVEPANSWHQPVELPDGTVLWKSNSRGGSMGDLQFPPSKAQSNIKESTSSESEYAADDDREIGVVCGRFASQTSSSVIREQKQEEETENDEEGGVEEGECKIDILNNDCLMHIFSFLTKRVRIKIERVCKRWQMVCLDMWVCQKHLDFSSVFPLTSAAVLNMPILRSFLKRCGKNLQSLDLSHKPHNLNTSVLQTVAAMCKNLRYLNLAGLPVTSAGLRSLSTISHELIVLNLDGCSILFDKELQNVFVHSPHLESVTLSNCALTGKCLYGLGHAPLKELVLDKCNNLRSRNLVRGLRLLKGLNKLSLNCCMNLTNTDVTDVIRALPKLHSLSVAGYFPLITSATLKSLDELHDLKSLNLQLNPAVNDHVLDAITRSCHRIEELNIAGCSSNSWDTVPLTDVGFRCLAALPNLVSLVISYSAKLSDSALEAVASRGKLQKLVCRGCPSFTDVGCIRVLTSCNELEHFDFSGCDSVSNATLQAALDSVKLRTNNIKLTLIVGGTMVYKPHTFEKNPLLEVDSSDLCVGHLRPDFVDNIYFPSSDEDYDDRTEYCMGCDYSSACSIHDPYRYNSVDWDG